MPESFPARWWDGSHKLGCLGPSQPPGVRCLDRSRQDGGTAAISQVALGHLSPRESDVWIVPGKMVGRQP